MNSYKYVISLRIRHPNMRAEEIQNRLGLEVKRMWSAGQSRETPIGRPLEGFYQDTYCSFFLKEKEGMDLAESLNNCCDELYQYKKFFSLLVRTGGVIEFLIGWFVNNNCAETFDVKLFSKLQDLGINISLDLYPYTPTDKECT